MPRYSDLEEYDVSTTTDWCYELVRSELFSALIANASYQPSPTLVTTQILCHAVSPCDTDLVCHPNSA